MLFNKIIRAALVGIFVVLACFVSQGQSFRILNSTGNSSASLIAASEDRLYFRGYDTAHGFELWVTYGADEGAHMVKDINKGNGSANIGNSIIYNNKLYFDAFEEVHGRELWCTREEDTGALFLKDIIKGKQGSNPNYLTVCNGKLYFSAEDSSPDQAT